MSNFHYSMATIAEAVGGRLLVGADTEADIDRVIIDSRHADTSPGALFIALSGPRHDGHDHIAELRQRGVRNFIVRKDRNAEAEGVNAIVVDDTLAALQRFAAWHRSHFKIPVIGITGSNGKTIVKEWLWQMLHHEENIVRSPGSWNSQVGVPLSVLRMGPEHTLGIFEAGISKPGEMEKLEPIIRPTIGVLTNIGDAHDEGFGGDRALKVSEKRKLFKGAGVVVRRAIGGERAGKDLTVGADEGDFVQLREARVLGGSCNIDVAHFLWTPTADVLSNRSQYLTAHGCFGTSMLSNTCPIQFNGFGSGSAPGFTHTFSSFSIGNGFSNRFRKLGLPI